MNTDFEKQSRAELFNLRHHIQQLKMQLIKLGKKPVEAENPIKVNND